MIRLASLRKRLLVLLLLRPQRRLQLRHTIDEDDAEDGREFEDGRKVINGVDKKKLIASYALVFEKALKAGGYAQKELPEPVQPIPDDPGVQEPVKPTVPVAPLPEPWWLSLIKALLSALTKGR